MIDVRRNISRAPTKEHQQQQLKAVFSLVSPTLLATIPKATLMCVAFSGCVVLRYDFRSPGKERAATKEGTGVT